jgi:hypothetical protein
MREIMNLLKWIAILALFVGGWAALLTTIACLIHFQILSALGFLLLTAVCFVAHTVLLEVK